MTNKQQQIPAIRFNGFTDTWEQRKLGELVETAYQGINTAADRVEYADLGTAILQSKHITSGNISFEDARFLNKKNYGNYFPKYVPKRGDILFANIGTIGPSTIVDTENEFLIAWNILKLTIKSDNNSHFIQQNLDKLNEMNFFEAITTGNATKFIKKDEMLGIKIFSPSIEEQNKISEFFRKLNDTIALHQRQMDNYKELKKTSMQKIFNQELRFKDKNGNDYPVWQKKKLKDLGKFYSGTGFNDKYQGYLDLSIPFFKVSDMNIASNSKYMVESNNTVDDDICREMKINKITGPAILFAKVGAAIYMERKRIVHNDFLMDNNMMALRINDSVDIEFTYYLCQSLSFSKYAQVGALPSYNASDIGRLHCKLPVISEQKKIAIFLSILDQKVNEAAQKVELFKELKKGLMQQMFF